MIRFVKGTSDQFDSLANMLEDGNCHVFNDCKMPAGTTPETTRLGFEKSVRGYKVMVDYGLTTTCDDGVFKRFLETGEAEFTSIAAMRAFFAGFAPLFKENEGVVDFDEVERLRSMAQQRKVVHPEKIAAPLKEKIFGQDAAIDDLAHQISTHLIAPAARPLVVSLLGPCGVGKTETAESLAKILSDLYGVKYGFISEAGNTIKSEAAVQKFLGAPPSYVGYGDATVFEPVRSNPYHVIVIDEIERAHPVLLEALMEALDKGYLSMNDNSPKIDLRKCIIIFTSNLPVNMEEYAQRDDFKKTEYCRDIFTDFTGKPAITRRISEFIVYNGLTDRAKAQIIIGYIKDELANFGADVESVDTELILSFLSMETKYGASEIRNIVRKAVSYKLVETGNADAFDGKRLKLSGTYNDIVIEVVE